MVEIVVEKTVDEDRSTTLIKQVDDILGTLTIQKVLVLILLLYVAF